MKKQFDVVLVVPAGPGTNPVFLADTIDSFMHYTMASFKVVVIDDSGKGLGNQIRDLNPSIDVLHSRKTSGSMAGLYLMLAEAYAYVLEHYDFIALLKMDTDALIIGPHPEREAVELFSNEAGIGIAGQYPLDYHGNPWDIGWPRDRVINGATTWKMMRRPIANMVLRKLYIKAVKNGYKAGESVFGGAYFISQPLLLALRDHKLLPNKILGNLNMGEDHLFALLAKAVGFDLGCLSAPGLPFAMAWKGLPASPAQLYSENKKLIHSTRQWEDWGEEEIRDFFRGKRQETKTAYKNTGVNV